jgi:hypothetical protein
MATAYRSADPAAREKAERLAVESEELARGDARLSLADRDGCIAILAVRSREFSEFTMSVEVPVPGTSL